MYNICKLKNISQSVYNVLGKEMTVNEEWILPDQLRIKAKSDSVVLSKITNDELQVGSDSEYFTEYGKQIDWLRSKQYETNDDGELLTAPTFENTHGLNARWKSYKYIVSSGTLNMFDEPIVTELKLRGGYYQLLDSPSNPKAEVGDYLEFSVVDKDDVLGLFSVYGLTVGVDVLELKKFVVKDYISPYDSSKTEFKTNGSFDVLPGLYFRTTYKSTGSQDVTLKVGSFHYEA